MNDVNNQLTSLTENELQKVAGGHGGFGGHGNKLGHNGTTRPDHGSTRPDNGGGNGTAKR
jgi:bacteriocin-like protein